MEGHQEHTENAPKVESSSTGAENGPQQTDAPLNPQMNAILKDDQAPTTVSGSVNQIGSAQPSASQGQSQSSPAPSSDPAMPASQEISAPAEADKDEKQKKKKKKKKNKKKKKDIVIADFNMEAASFVPSSQLFNQTAAPETATKVESIDTAKKSVEDQLKSALNLNATIFVPTTPSQAEATKPEAHTKPAKAKQQEAHPTTKEPQPKTAPKALYQPKQQQQ